MPDNIETLIPKLERLKKSMVEVGSEMKCYGHNEMHDHGDEMLGAAKVVSSWIDGIREEIC